VIMGNKRLWAALEARTRFTPRPEMTDADGMKLGELEGIGGERWITRRATPRSCCKASTSR